MIIDQSQPEPSAIILEETVLEEGFKHTERDINIDDIEDTEVDEYLAKIRNFDADLIMIFICLPTKEPYSLALLVALSAFKAM